MHSGSIQPVQWWRLWDPIQPVASPQYNIIEQSPNWHIVSKDNLHCLMELWMVDMLALLYKANVSRLATALQWRELWWVWKGCQPEHAIEVVGTRQGTFYMEEQANRRWKRQWIRVLLISWSASCAESVFSGRSCWDGNLVNGLE